MKIQSFTQNLIPSSNIALFSTHIQMPPYINKWNYHNSISKFNHINYCQNSDIDYVSAAVDQCDKYNSICVNSSSWKYDNKLSLYPTYQIYNLLDKYQYIFILAGNHLIHKNVPTIRNIIDKHSGMDGYSVIDYEGHEIMKLKTYYDEIKFHKDKQSIKYYINNMDRLGFFGPCIIVNNKFKEWYNIQKYYEYQHDMVYKAQYNYHHNEQYNLIVDTSKVLFKIDSYNRDIIQRLGPIYNQYLIMKQIKNIDFSSKLQDQKYFTTFFGGCGAFSSIWQLRYLIMRHMYTEYKEYYW